MACPKRNIDVLSADAALYDSARFRLEEPGSYLPTGACGIIAEVFIFFGVGGQDL